MIIDSWQLPPSSKSKNEFDLPTKKNYPNSTLNRRRNQQTHHRFNRDNFKVLSIFCKNIFKDISGCVNKLSIGVASSLILTPTSLAVTFIAYKLGLFSKLVDSTCLNEHFDNKLMLYTSVVLIGPIYEEIIYRGYYQDFILTRVPNYCFKNLTLTKNLLDSRIVKLARITFVSYLFAKEHLEGPFPDDYKKAQAISAFTMGFGLGLLKESKAGLLGALGAHTTHNLLVLMLTAYAEKIKKT